MMANLNKILNPPKKRLIRTLAMALGALQIAAEEAFKWWINDNKTHELCPRCECKYESRNTTIIKVVVIIVIWIISLLVIYMLFLICLDPLLNKRAKSSYVEHTNEDVSVQTILKLRFVFLINALFGKINETVTFCIQAVLVNAFQAFSS
ncbi:uncharacterized protein LOC124374790 [Homalodisca vitripennis]|uniref:uncharacterized protein LOC124374790 n=1 Tax=Homalodisca vitripennis TaxID=197043 RepID=UPI001EEBD19D|nr:uncharacterized protein LOC124374790 [Homalodisca vitripennis]